MTGGARNRGRFAAPLLTIAAAVGLALAAVGAEAKDRLNRAGPTAKAAGPPVVEAGFKRHDGFRKRFKHRRHRHHFDGHRRHHKFHDHRRHHKFHDHRRHHKFHGHRRHHKRHFGYRGIPRFGLHHKFRVWPRQRLCRVWFPHRPRHLQPPAAPCKVLRHRVPHGAFLYFY